VGASPIRRPGQAKRFTEHRAVPRGGCRACAHEELRDACGTSSARSAFRSGRARWLPRPQRAQGQHESRLLSRQPRACQASVLCISLWIVSVNMLVNHCTAVDVRGCGKVDNRGEASPGRAPQSAVHRRSEVSTGQLCSLLFLETGVAESSYGRGGSHVSETRRRAESLKNPPPTTLLCG